MPSAADESGLTEFYDIGALKMLIASRGDVPPAGLGLKILSPGGHTRAYILSVDAFTTHGVCT